MSKGLECPKCGKSNTRVYLTRHPHPEVIVRRRRCLDCNRTFWSMEASMPDDAVRWAGSDITLEEEFRYPSWY